LKNVILVREESVANAGVHLERVRGYGVKGLKRFKIPSLAWTKREISSS